MKYLVVILSLLVASAFCRSAADYEETFHELWNDPAEEASVEKHVESEEASIEKENEAFAKGEASFDEKLNAISLIPKEEFEEEKTGLTIEATVRFPTGAIDVPAEFRVISREDREYLDNLYANLSRQGIPSSFDARTTGKITPPKNQMSCGSCAAFSATAVHETCLARAGTPTAGLDLAEQQAIDCGYNGNSMNGCHGAWVTAYQNWMASSGGAVSHEAQYPYQDRNPNLKCLSKPKWNAGAVVSKAVIEYDCTEERLKSLVYKYGAVSTGIYASDDSFGNYHSGVYDQCSNNNINHAVTVVGYGNENGKDYWLIKNSWGDNWGAGGYIKIHRGSRQCNIGGTCATTECTKTGNASPAPVAPPPPPIPPSQFCDISKLYGRSDITGRYTLTTTFGSNKYVSDVECTNSVCKPQVAGPSNACVYICGQLQC